MALSDTTVRIKLVGHQLRRHRIAAGLGLVEAAQKIGLHHTRLSRMETGKYHQKCEDVAGLLGLYGVTGSSRQELLQLSRYTDESGLWQRNSSLYKRVAALEALESIAIGMINFECNVIPGLLQTLPYTEALIRNSGMFDNEEDLGQRVAVRIHRQGVLRKPGAPQLIAIIAESALHNLVGDRTIMREQLIYLTEATQRRNIFIRIVPATSTSSAGLDGPFMRLQFRGRRGVVVLENRSSNLFLEGDDDLLLYNQVAARLLDVALGNTDSVALLHDLATRLAEEQLQQ
jgi:Domain of unknown function (DUF5753)/Helix-turn-helix domain